jgi:hypothetical protein
MTGIGGKQSGKETAITYVVDLMVKHRLNGRDEIVVTRRRGQLTLFVDRHRSLSGKTRGRPCGTRGQERDIRARNGRRSG